MNCSFGVCLLETETERERIPQFWKVHSGVLDPRRNAVKLVTTVSDHPLGLPKKAVEVGGVYFEWLQETAFSKVRLHLVREYQTDDVELAEAVNNWLRRKMDELWLVAGT